MFLVTFLKRVFYRAYLKGGDGSGKWRPPNLRYKASNDLTLTCSP